tara:strand:- start:45 stop:1013 length:969 start_codon:yes stop_codon:yes gene_type:complete
MSTKVCVIGGGSWGSKHIKTLIKLEALVGVVEINDQQGIKIKNLFPNITYYNSLDKAIEADFDGYIIATPPSTHYALAKKILKIQKPVLVEKPLSLSVKDGESLKKELIKVDGKLVVGHLLLFHPAILKIKSMIKEGMIGDIQYLYSNRLNFGKVRKEENVFWSFAPHDISLFQFFSNSFPDGITSVGGAFLQKNIMDTTMTYLKYPNGIHGHIYVSWLHPFKEHRLVIIGSKGTIHFEDSSIKKPLLFYEKDEFDGIDLESLRPVAPRKIEYDSKLPLENELYYFIDIINGKPVDKCNINEGIDVLKILEMASKSSNPNKF